MPKKKKKVSKTYKAYCDASFKEGQVILSMVVLSPRDKLMYQTTEKHTFEGGSTRAELMAMRNLLKHIVRLNIQDVLVISDSQQVVRSVNTPDWQFKSEQQKILNAMLQTIRETIPLIQKIRIEHRKRDENGLADSLCRLRRQDVAVRKHGGKVDAKQAVTSEQNISLLI